MSQQDQQVLPSQAQPAASTDSNCLHSLSGKHWPSPDGPKCLACGVSLFTTENLEPLRVLDAVPRAQAMQLVGQQEELPVVDDRMQGVDCPLCEDVPPTPHIHKPVVMPQANWPIVGGVYKSRITPATIRYQVLAINDGRVFFDKWYNDETKPWSSSEISISSFKDLAFPAAQPVISALANALKDLRGEVKEKSDRSYCEYAERGLGIAELLGSEAKLASGTFGQPELNAHRQNAALLGAHHAYASILPLIDAALALVGEEVSRG